MSHTPPYLDKFYPDLYRGLGEVAKDLRRTFREVDLPTSLTELINVRVSQINGCAACLSIHTEAARRNGVEQIKLDVLPAWREVDDFDDREKAALQLAETLTVLPPGENHSEAALLACRTFAEEQVAALEWGIILINAYNRISIASGHPPIRRSKPA